MGSAVKKMTLLFREKISPLRVDPVEKGGRWGWGLKVKQQNCFPESPLIHFKHCKMNWVCK